MGTECGLASSDDRGATWDFIDPTPGDGGGLRTDQHAVVASSGVFFTTDIGASPVVWQPLGTGLPAGSCAIAAAQASYGTPTFLLRAGAGACGMGGTGALWRRSGATTTGAWTQIRRGGATSSTTRTRVT